MSDTLTDAGMAMLADHNIRHIGEMEGELIDVLGVRQNWKVRARDTGYAFSIYEMELQPGQGVPLHAHPFPEFFRVLEGEVEFARIGSDRQVEWLRTRAGESINAPIGAPHGFTNRSSHPAKLLSTSTYYHEAIFEQAGHPARSGDPVHPVDQNGIDKFTKVASAHQASFLNLPDSGRVFHGNDLITSGADELRNEEGEADNG